MVKWQNWSGSQSATFSALLEPETESDLVRMVEQSTVNNTAIKARGSSHSFSRIIARENAQLISLDKLSGIGVINTHTHTVRVLAGTKLKDLSKALWEQGFALANLGDIDVQSVAGAISTGTHGTGIKFGNLATFVEEIELVTPSRGLWKVRRGIDPEFEHIVVGPGIFGVVLAYTIHVVPRYYLELQLFPESIDKVKDNFDDRFRNSRNYEFFYFPATSRVLTKLSREVEVNDLKISAAKSDFIANYLENTLFGVLNEACYQVPLLYGPVRSLVAACLPTSVKIDRCYSVYATARHLRFQEMEYSIPYDAFWQTFADIQKLVKAQSINTLFPIECRITAGDSLSLSPSTGMQPRAYIALHTYYRDMQHLRYFREAEAIFLAVGGRPHWGKMFFAKAQQFAAMYPKLEQVRTLRHNLDPNKLMLNDTLSAIFYP